MPGYDKTGPSGQGPMTGGRRGYCVQDKYQQSQEDVSQRPEVVEENPQARPRLGLGRGPFGKGLAQRMGRGFGQGRGFGRGFGRRAR